MSGIKYKESGYYMALSKSSKDGISVEERKRDKKYWEVVQYKNGRFFRINNLNSYSEKDFDSIASFELFDKLQAMQAKINVLSNKLNVFIESRKNIDTHYDAIEALMKTIKTVVDQINGDIVLSCGDLESVNIQIVNAYTRYQTLINGE